MGLGVISIIAGPLAFWFWWPWEIITALILGYTSHLAADACTRSGVRVLYPNQQSHYLPPHRFRLMTGSIAEQVLLPFLIAAVLVLLLGYLPPY
jgi:membrane-bound metal-dependent hydrolase YbcI (DUF457 family)